MDFSPLNIRMAVPHTNDVGELQNNLNHHGAMVQSYRTAKDKEQQRVQQTQVRKKDEAENEKIKDDPDRQKKQGSYQSKRHRKLVEALDADEPQEEEIPMAVDQFRGQHIDISG